MLNKIFISFVLFFGFMVSGVANAQECNANYEMITKLYHPKPGSFTVWDSLYGQGKSEERFVSVVNRDDGEVLVVGEVINFKGGSPSLVFVQYDIRGRQVWEKTHQISGLNNIVKMMRHKDGVVVLLNRKARRGKAFLWLGFFDYKGVLKSQKVIKDKKYDLVANDIIHSAGGEGHKGFAIPVTIERDFGEGKSKVTRKNAVVYLLDENGNKLSSRSYLVGSGNEIMSLSVSKLLSGKEGYNATGYFESPTGSKIGWFLRLDKDTSYIWQKEYVRGLSAKINMSFGYYGRYILTFGDVLPVGDAPLGSWLMLLDGEDGKVMWQRYYYGDTGYHDYLSKGLYVSDNGLITLMMMAKPDVNKTIDDLVSDGGGKADHIYDYVSYAHLLTLSPRGVTLFGDAYYLGQGISISQVIEGENGFRVMAGSALVPAESMKEKSIKKKHPSPLIEQGYVNLPDVDLSEKANKGLAMLKHKIKAQEIGEPKENHHEESAKKEIGHDRLTQNGWVLIGNMPEAYTDPCVKTSRGLE